MTSQLRWRLVIGISAVALVFGLSVLKGMEWAFGQPLPWWVVIFWGTSNTLIGVGSGVFFPREQLAQSTAGFWAVLLPPVFAIVTWMPPWGFAGLGIPSWALAPFAAGGLATVSAWYWMTGKRVHVVGRRALGVSLPFLTVALCASGTIPSEHLTTYVWSMFGCAALLLIWGYRDGARTLERFDALVTHVSEIRIDSMGMVRPTLAAASEYSLQRFHDALDREAVQLAARAQADAKAREAIIDARQLRTRFMASMSHELRSPLNSIVGFAYILERGMDGPLVEGQQESVQIIRQAAQELIRLISDIVDLARIEAGRLNIHCQWIPSVEILTEAVRRGGLIVEGKKVQIVPELQPGLPPVYVDRARIVQAVVALFRNAAISLEEARILLRARVGHGPPGPQRHLRVEIHDALDALPPDQVARIFDAFREISAPTGRRLGGLGMALSLSRELVRLHGGDVWADAWPGVGTVLSVALPLDGPAPVSKSGAYRIP